MPIPNSRGGKINFRPLMGETEQSYGKLDECMEGNVIDQWKNQ